MAFTTYKHEALSRPKEQIRLLKIKGGRDDEDLAVTLQTWNVNEAPDFDGVSYTWGGDVNYHLSVNEQPLQIRRNCHYALWQVRLHHPEEYIWIDSICINQDDLQERGCQVPLMEKIYTRAVRTLACIGPHENNSQMLTTSVQQMKDTNRGAAEADGTMDCAGSRLSEGRVQLFCGDDVFTWGDIELILQLVGGGENDQGFLTAPPSRLWEGDGIESVLPSFQLLESLSRFDTGTYLDNVLFTTFKSQCSDPRDHIYGILCLVKWKDGQAPIVPDYTKSAFRLAIEAIARIRDMAVVPLLLEVLGIHHADSEMTELFTHRSSVKGQRIASTLGNTQVEVKLGYNEILRCAEILVDENERLTVAARPKHWSTERLEHERQHLKTAFPTGLRQGNFQGNSHTHTLLKGEACDVALASWGTQAGDIILPLPPLSLSSSSFIILRSNDISFDIVGQGFFLPGFEISGASDFVANEGTPLDHAAERSIFDAEMVLTMTIADILRLIGQDFVNLNTYSPEARLRRLVTCAVDQPKGAVAPLYIHDYSYEEH